MGVFRWEKASAGYRVIKSAKPRAANGQSGHSLIVEVVPPTDTFTTRRSYFPLDECSGLFRTFADTRRTVAGVLEFANRFGLLGHGLVAGDGKDPELGTGVTGEIFQVWDYEICELRQAVQLWNHCQQGQRSALEFCIQWQPEAGGFTVFYSPPLELFPEIPQIANVALYERAVISSCTVYPELLGLFTPGDPVAPALAYVQRVANKRLEVHTQARLATDAGTGRLTLEVMPNNLLGAIWLQFATAISENKEYRQCRECSQWFETTRDGGRVSRQFCSNACRSKAYRERQNRACQMHANGKSYRDIAAELESDVATVKRWVGSRKE